MTPNELIKQLFIFFNSGDKKSFEAVAKEYIDREKRKKHNIVAKELEKALFDRNFNEVKQRRFKSSIPIPRDTEKGFPLLEIFNYSYDFSGLIVSHEVKDQIDQIIREFKEADILSTYNLENKKKILLCGKPGTGKTYTVQIISSLLSIPLVYVRFDSIISSYLGETAANLRKVFDFIQNGTWIVLFDEFDIIGKNRDDIHEHGEIKRVVNNFLQMLDSYNSDSLVFAATNHQHILDTAIWRRFDEVVYFNLPDYESRKKIADYYIKIIKRNKDIVIEQIAELTKGFSAADIKMIIHESMKLSIINKKNEVGMNEIEKAINKFIRREDVKNNKLRE